MKKIFFTCIFIVPLFSFCQDSTTIKSKYEEFTSSTGKMIKTEIFEAGSEKDYNLSISKATDLEAGISIKAVQIYQTKNLFLVGPYKTGVLFIDWEEVPGFIKALQFQLNLLDSKPSNNITYSYSTTNGVITTCSYVVSGFGAGWTVIFGVVYKYSRALAGNVLTIKKKDLSNIISLLEQGLKKDY